MKAWLKGLIVGLVIAIFFYLVVLLSFGWSNLIFFVYLPYIASLIILFLIFGVVIDFVEKTSLAFVWKGGLIGLIIGVIISAVVYFTSKNINFSFIISIIVVGMTLIGVVIGWIVGRAKSRTQIVINKK